MIGIGLALVLFAQAAQPAPRESGPEVAALIAPVQEAIDAEVARQAATCV